MHSVCSLHHHVSNRGSRPSVQSIDSDIFIMVPFIIDVYSISSHPLYYGAIYHCIQYLLTQSSVSSDPQPPLPPGWYRTVAGNGQYYYFNETTQQRTWVDPRTFTDHTALSGDVSRILKLADAIPPGYEMGTDLSGRSYVRPAQSWSPQLPTGSPRQDDQRYVRPSSTADLAANRMKMHAAVASIMPRQNTAIYTGAATAPPGQPKPGPQSAAYETDFGFPESSYPEFYGDQMSTDTAGVPPHIASSLVSSGIASGAIPPAGVPAGPPAVSSPAQSRSATGRSSRLAMTRRGHTPEQIALGESPSQFSNGTTPGAVSPVSYPSSPHVLRFPRAQSTHQSLPLQAEMQPAHRSGSLVLNDLQMGDLQPPYAPDGNFSGRASHMSQPPPPYDAHLAGSVGLNPPYYAPQPQQLPSLDLPDPSNPTSMQYSASGFGPRAPTQTVDPQSRLFNGADPAALAGLAVGQDPISPNTLALLTEDLMQADGTLMSPRMDFSGGFAWC
eukprot:m.45651 g.45651  ORF g.45651 m.45651 type:complete len:499 (+) comp5891_c0_seq4:591-2087(+)